MGRVLFKLEFSMSVSALEFWLSSLSLSCHLDTFLDNGYDDLEICEKVELCSELSTVV